MTGICARGIGCGFGVGLHGLHFAFTITFHYIFPQLTMELALLIVVLKITGALEVLPSNTTPDFSLTIYNAAAAEHELVIGLWWFILGMAHAIAYSVFTYRHFAGKVD